MAMPPDFSMATRRVAPPRARATRCLTACALAAAGSAAAATMAHAQTPVFGVHAGGPVRASIVAGVWLGDDPRHEDANGVVAVVEPGLRGGRVSLGYAYSVSTLGSFVTARATALRTWRVPTGNRNYVGLEAQLLPLLAIGPRLSAFVPTGHHPRKLLWMLDVGVGI
jgi:hypothetical protein